MKRMILNKLTKVSKRPEKYVPRTLARDFLGVTAENMEAFDLEEPLEGVLSALSIRNGVPGSCRFCPIANEIHARGYQVKIGRTRGWMKIGPNKILGFNVATRWVTKVVDEGGKLKPGTRFLLAPILDRQRMKSGHAAPIIKPRGEIRKVSKQPPIVRTMLGIEGTTVR